MRVEQIEDITVVVEDDGELVFHVPSTMSGFELTLLKLRNQKTISTLKQLSHDKRSDQPAKCKTD